MSELSETKMPTVDPDKHGEGTTHSSVAMNQGGSGKAASAEELSKALGIVMKQNAELQKRLDAQASAESGIDKLANLLADKIGKTETGVIPDTDNINRTTDFRNSKMYVDNQSLQDAQATASYFRHEEKCRIVIPKSIAAFVGANLDITVNGCRVSIPCDGKEHFINKTHYEHARERLAKLDALNTPVDGIAEIG